MRELRTLIFALAATLALAINPVSFAQDTHDAAAAVEGAVDTHAADSGHAADDHGGDHAAGAASPIAKPKEGIAAAVTTLITFAIVFGVLYVAVWPKIVGGLDDRAGKIRDDLAAAESERRQAKDALDAYEKNLAEARAESQRMIEETRAQQGELAKQLKTKADADLAELRAKATAEIENAKKAAIAEIYAESVNLATVMAGKILAREVSSGDQQRLVSESLAQMQAKA